MSLADNAIGANQNLAGFAIWRKYPDKEEEALLNRISFVDALRWLLWSPPGADVPELLVNPRRRRPSEPRRLKRGRKRFPQLRGPRNASRKPVAEVRM